MAWFSFRSKKDPEPIDPADAYARGMHAWKNGELDTARTLLEQAASAEPTQLKYVGNLGNFYHERKEWLAALKCHRQATELDPTHAGALRNQGNALLELGRFIEAARTFEASLELEPDHSDSAVLCAHALASSGNPEGAWIRCEKSIRDGAEGPDLHTIYLKLLLHCEQWEKAREAGELPHIAAPVLHQLGVRYLRANECEKATEILERAVAESPDDPGMVFNLAIAQKNLGEKQKAKESFARAAALAPEDPRPTTNLGWMQLQSDESALALDTLRKAAELQSRQSASEEELRAVPAHRLRHDADQFHHLLSHSELSTEAEEYAHRIIALASALPAGPGFVDLTDPQHQAIRDRWNQRMHLPPCPEIEGGALNPNLDANRITANYLESTPEIVVVDDLLRPETLRALQAYCRDATIWKQNYENGYLGAFMRSGLATPLLIQISEELRAALPGIIGEHRLEQCWAFKCDNELEAVNLHADVAAINVNFWISPDEGNQNPDEGGLLVWDVESPDDWSFADYNGNQEKMRRFLASNESKPIRVPHRCNRAVIFNSTLFHESDRFSFSPDYEKRRINLTFLYGIRLLEA